MEIFFSLPHIPAPFINSKIVSYVSFSNVITSCTASLIPRSEQAIAFEEMSIAVTLNSTRFVSTNYDSAPQPTSKTFPLASSNAFVP
jgi:hypothetical protein